jgi:hypothetical protein
MQLRRVVGVYLLPVECGKVTVPSLRFVMMSTDQWYESDGIVSLLSSQ